MNCIHPLKMARFATICDSNKGPTGNHRDKLKTMEGNRKTILNQIPATRPRGKEVNRKSRIERQQMKRSRPWARVSQNSRAGVKPSVEKSVYKL